MDDAYLKKVITTGILIALLVLAFFLLKPILLSIIVGFLLAFLFSPVYTKINKKIKSKNLSSFLICLTVIIIIIIPFWFLTPIFVEQSIKIYLASQQMDFVTPFKTIFPSLFSSDQFSQEIGSILQSFVTKTANSIVNSLSDLILNFPTIFLQSLVVFFTFFFVLRDKKEIVLYLMSLSPFSEEIEKKLFDSSKGITSSVIYGQIFIGIIQGIVAGVGFLAFGVPNALFLSLLATLAGIFPVIGTAIVWIPVAVYILIAGNTFSAIGVTIFGVLSSSLDNFLRPIIVSRMTHMHSLLVLVGMIGGLFLFGIIGLIIGPLVLAYLLIMLETYRSKKIPGLFTKIS